MHAQMVSSEISSEYKYSEYATTEQTVFSGFTVTCPKVQLSDMRKIHSENGGEVMA